MAESMKIVVVGTGGVGKSAMTLRFVKNEWVSKYDPTFCDSYAKTVEVDGEAIDVEILDTAGQEAYAALREKWLHEGHGFVLVYSIVKDETLEDLVALRDQILEANPNPDVPMILVGNKLDLEDERVVSKKEGDQQATAFNCVNFVEVSAKEDIGVSGAFETLIRTVAKTQPGIGNGAGSGDVFGAGVSQEKRDEVTAPEDVEPTGPDKVEGCGCVIA
mmetsp:Transcript_7559/g.19308  ORF Transcript_7559/g.19308 Transcript_7559/m.19308 type:complete len:218 (-) Transcript_7559:212-865(-)|eukprot:CAMPEP_0119507408 /NCGR_PEP_ID=MMETSP1344-20130328/27311_1 /TAXON_ID=236787 /ORGANISM="Florenciella parvula, Strain CCMP2471" /LENGTH=217 /DNA_ID=CAMNT_0007544041 /DNA_START=72 /DNA_END=725 /DNA_ORIENTATION=+